MGIAVENLPSDCREERAVGPTAERHDDAAKTAKFDP